LAATARPPRFLALLAPPDPESLLGLVLQGLIAACSKSSKNPNKKKCLIKWKRKRCEKKLESKSTNRSRLCVRKDSQNKGSKKSMNRIIEFKIRKISREISI
jgi:hypothetical protein